MPNLQGLEAKAFQQAGIPGHAYKDVGDTTGAAMRGPDIGYQGLALASIRNTAKIPDTVVAKLMPSLKNKPTSNKLYACEANEYGFTPK